MPISKLEFIVVQTLFQILYEPSLHFSALWAWHDMRLCLAPLSAIKIEDNFKKTMEGLLILDTSSG